MKKSCFQLGCSKIASQVLQTPAALFFIFHFRVFVGLYIYTYNNHRSMQQMDATCNHKLYGTGKEIKLVSCRDTKDIRRRKAERSYTLVRNLETHLFSNLAITENFVTTIICKQNYFFGLGVAFQMISFFYALKSNPKRH